MSSGSDNEVEPVAHAKLLDSVSNLRDCQHIRPPKRFNLSGIHDEFHLSKPTEDLKGNSALGISDVVNVLKRSKRVETSKKLIDFCKTSKVLKPPLEKPVEQKLSRAVAYQKVKKDLGKWNAIVAKNRSTETQIFPLNAANDTIKIINSNASEDVQSPAAKTDLMKAFDAIDAKLRLAQGGGEVSKSKDAKIQNTEEENSSVPSTLLKYLKIRQNQISSRLRMQNRIKSKNYHKLKKKEKFKKQIQDFDQLRKTNPEAALQKLEEIEKHRVLERANLRHKNTGVWAKNVKVRAKYDENVRKDLEDQISLSRELTQKQNISDNEQSDNDACSLSDCDETISENAKILNPWEKLGSNTAKQNQNEGYRKYWAKRNESNISAKKKTSKKVIENGWTVEEISESSEESGSEDDLKNLEDLSFKKPISYKSTGNTLNETGYKEKPENISTIFPKILPEMPLRTRNVPGGKKKSVEIQNLVSDDYDNVDFKSRRMEINEAFEDDDVVADFKNQEKSKVEENNDINLTVPGWGSWAGIDISQDQLKNKKRTLKFPRKKPVNLKETVYVSDEVNKKLKRHLVSDVPFPFTSVKDFEASIRGPVGRSFVPEKAYRLLTKPAVITRKGHVINPMDENELVKT